uniref:Zinc finger Y-chromosomal protein n=1 Tax=Cacopsylla melanoneura TaxID=428564 RepID=A0A8D8Z5Y9_9HEMI
MKPTNQEYVFTQFYSSVLTNWSAYATLNSSLSELIAFCIYCNKSLNYETETIMNHCKCCKGVTRPTKFQRYVCCLCTKYRHSDASKMRSHIRTHTKDRPFKCFFCEYRSNERSNVKAHMIRRHAVKT